MIKNFILALLLAGPAHAQENISRQPPSHSECGTELAPRCHDIADMRGWLTPRMEAACGQETVCRDVQDCAPGYEAACHERDHGTSGLRRTNPITGKE